MPGLGPGVHEGKGATEYHHIVDGRAKPGLAARVSLIVARGCDQLNTSG
jgi:hypothetical protein